MDKIINAFNSSNNKDYSLHIIGACFSEKWVQYLKSLSKPNVKFHINCSEQEKINILNNTKFIINAVGLDRNKDTEAFAYEHFGISMIEGINCGCIPISVNGGFPETYVKNDSSRLIFSSMSELVTILNTISISPHAYTFDLYYYRNILQSFTKDAYIKRLNNIIMQRCNITGNYFQLGDKEKHRELGCKFGYNNRFRAVCYVLTKMLFNDVIIMYELDIDKTIRGIGMSDSGWATICEQKFDYTNTYYHKAPFLDIYNEDHVNNYKLLDFIISSDVFEHINPFPGIQIAFNNLYNMLKKGGFIVFSVPYNNIGEHIEHYPNLYDYTIKLENNKYILYNTTIDGKSETFNHLCFHGGPGNTLEMRVFSKKSIIAYLENSGFTDITFHNITEDMNKYGIFWSIHNKDYTSLIITARK